MLTVDIDATGAQGWKDKVVRCNQGDQAWGLFEATKNFSR